MVGEMHHAVAQLMVKVPDFAGALPYARRAAELQPGTPAIFLTLSRIYLGMELPAEAMAAIDRLLALDPKHGDGLIDKGQLLQAQGRLDEAIKYYEEGLKIYPQSVAALNNMGGCYLLKDLVSDAVRCFEAAAEIWPNSPKPRNNVGAALKEVGQIDDAIGQFRRAIRIDPSYADSYCNLGGCYALIAEHESAISVYRDALKIKPDFTAVGSNLLMAMLSPENVSSQALFDEHVAWARDNAAALAGEIRRFEPRDPNRRLKIAYISPDFREHSIRYFIEPILANHDRSRFEVLCFAAGRRRDEVTERLAKLVDGWHSIAELNDRQLAEKIRAMEVDILIDLAGHTADHRLLALARRAAPVQVTYLGYPTTTGLDTVDYRLTDAIADPPENDRFYSEKLVRLPHAFFVYNDDPSKPYDPGLPVDRTGVFTFGSFNNFSKFNDETLDSWAAILRGVPNSRLLIKAKPVENPSTQEKLLTFFADRGITQDRLDLRVWVPMDQHIALLGSGIDLMLDTFPYNGHTTTCQALWMGVPTVTRASDNFRSRVGASIFHHLDLPELVAHSKQEYEQTAMSLAADLNRLREIRPTLRQRFMQSHLFDARGFTKDLEITFEQMWLSYSGHK